MEDCDFFFAFLHGYEDPQEIVGHHIHEIVPALLLPTPGKPIEKVKQNRSHHLSATSHIFFCVFATVLLCLLLLNTTVSLNRDRRVAYKDRKLDVEMILLSVSKIYTVK